MNIINLINSIRIFLLEQNEMQKTESKLSILIMALVGCSVIWGLFTKGDYPVKGNWKQTLFLLSLVFVGVFVLFALLKKF